VACPSDHGPEMSRCDQPARRRREPFCPARAGGEGEREFPTLGSQQRRDRGYHGGLPRLQGDRMTGLSGPFVIADQGSFSVGGALRKKPGIFDVSRPELPAGQTILDDHAQVFYQTPAEALSLPLVMWHGGFQFSRTWETSPDARDGFQTLFCGAGSRPTCSRSPCAGRLPGDVECPYRASGRRAILVQPVPYRPLARVL
jgi:hypothetical protein